MTSRIPKRKTADDFRKWSLLGKAGADKNCHRWGWQVWCHLTGRWRRWRPRRPHAMTILPHPPCGPTPAGWSPRWRGSLDPNALMEVPGGDTSPAARLRPPPPPPPPSSSSSPLSASRKPRRSAWEYRPGPTVPTPRPEPSEKETMKLEQACVIGFDVVQLDYM